jgi:hypothetical protein
MSNLAAVEPDRICIINSQRPDRLSFISRCHKSTEEASIAHGMAWVVKSCLSNRVVACIEMELDDTPFRNMYSVGIKGKAIFANINRLRGT